MNLYGLTRKLVARGCPEHPRLSVGYDGGTRIWVLQGDSGDTLELAASIAPPRESPGESADARALWTMHAIEWVTEVMQDAEVVWDTSAAFNRARVGNNAIRDRQGCCTESRAITILEAIEAATRHLGPQ